MPREKFFPVFFGLFVVVVLLFLFGSFGVFSGAGKAFSVNVQSPSSDVDVSDELVVGKSHVDASSVGDDPLDGSLSKEVVDVVVVKEDGVGVVQKDVVKNDVVKEVVDSLDSDDGVVDDDFGFDDVDVGDAVRGLSFPVVTRFVPGVGELRNGKLSFRHSDRLSSVRLKTAANTAQVTGEFLSLPFGQELIKENTRLAFATEKELDESGLYFFGARYYDPNIGRFTGVDPVRSNHAYSYVNNNPMNAVDPTGMAGTSLETLLRPNVAAPSSTGVYQPSAGDFVRGIAAEQEAQWEQLQSSPTAIALGIPTNHVVLHGRGEGGLQSAGILDPVDLFVGGALFKAATASKTVASISEVLNPTDLKLMRGVVNSIGRSNLNEMPKVLRRKIYKHIIYLDGQFEQFFRNNPGISDINVDGVVSTLWRGTEYSDSILKKGLRISSDAHMSALWVSPGRHYAQSFPMSSGDALLIKFSNPGGLTIPSSFGSLEKMTLRTGVRRGNFIGHFTTNNFGASFAEAGLWRSPTSDFILAN
ncbi:MAG: RHS repeat-associated core domain-containing protein [Candidatus Woesearchaeota archaeon]|nr:MAG: RHS repeat-associated core domain-containing protein [Candidatus Woesearchaeota archaeon]